MDSKKVKINVYYADWCGFCTIFKDDSSWKPFTEKAKSYGKNVYINKKEETDLSDDEKKVVNGFPTVIVNVDGKSYYYEGKRTPEDLFNFVDEKVMSSKVQSGGGAEYYTKKYMKYKVRYSNLKNKLR